LACCLNELRPALWLNFCLDKHDHLFVSHIGLLLSISLPACQRPAQPTVRA
jgi:hypothetical protein